MGIPAGMAGDGRVEDCVAGVMDPGEETVGSVAEAGVRFCVLMGKFKVKRLVCRAAAWARGGSDDLFCCKSVRSERVLIVRTRRQAPAGLGNQRRTRSCKSGTHAAVDHGRGRRPFPGSSP